jgi:hypothetical protein
VPPSPSGRARAVGRGALGWAARLADGRLRPGHGPAAGWGGARDTKAASGGRLGSNAWLVATPAIDERSLAAGSAPPGTVAAVSASPSSKASRRHRHRPWIGRAGTSATGVRMPNPIRMVTAPNSGVPRASQTRPGGRPCRRGETCMRAHGQVAGNSQPARVNDGQVLLPPVGWTLSTRATAPAEPRDRP